MPDAPFDGLIAPLAEAPPVDPLRSDRALEGGEGETLETANSLVENRNNRSKEAETKPPIYRAVGCMYATYRPDAENFRFGSLLTPDGQSFPATLHGWLLKQLGLRYPDRLENMAVFNEPQVWSVYPRTTNEQPLSLTIKKLNKTPDPQTLDNWVDRFTVVGEGYSRYAAYGIVIVRYNDLMRKPKHERAAADAFTLKLYGKFPKASLKQVWQFELERKGDQMVIQTAYPYDAVPSAKKSRAVRNGSAVEAQIPPPEEGSVSPSVEALIEVPASVPLAEETTAQRATQVDLSTRTRLQEDKTKEGGDLADNVEPLANTAIVHQLANSTPPKAQGQLSASKDFPDNPSPSERSGLMSPQPASSQTHPSGDEVAPRKGQQAKQGKEKAKSAPASGKSAKVPSAGQGRKVASSPSGVPQKQSAPGASAHGAAKETRPAFQVKVNNRSFVGYASVTLKGGMLRIDGKPVVTTKIAIVVGQPSVVEADGVVRSGNQTVLTSR